MQKHSVRVSTMMPLDHTDQPTTHNEHMFFHNDPPDWGRTNDLSFMTLNIDGLLKHWEFVDDLLSRQDHPPLSHTGAPCELP